jgi:undecaprenyl-diphosphatase
MTTFDRELFLHVNEFARATGWLHSLVYGWATYGIAFFAGLLVIGWWRARRADPAVMAAALWAPLATLLAVAVNQPIAAWVAEPRPYTSLQGILVLVHRSTDPSFPSDHAVMAGAVAASLFLVDRLLGEIAVVAAILIAFSRVYIGADYPFDVLAGLGLGIVVAVVGWLVARGMLTKVVQRLGSTPLRPLVTTNTQPATAS